MLPARIELVIFGAMPMKAELSMKAPPPLSAAELPATVRLFAVPRASEKK